MYAAGHKRGEKKKERRSLRKRAFGHQGSKGRKISEVRERASPGEGGKQRWNPYA